MSLFTELKRRNVFKVAAAYIIVGWLIMQAGATLAPALHLPEWVNSVLIFFLLLGFPLALFFAWAFEITPEGLKREHEVDRTQSMTPQTGKKLNLLITVVLILALGYFSYDKFVLSVGRDVALVEATIAESSASRAAQQPPAEADHSIAVLPFVNMSDDKSNEYFSDGMTEELLNVLARLHRLKVAARTSVFEFKGKGGDVREIGHKLGVSHIVEGSVRREGEHVRVTAQLVRVADGFHVWSESYDRELKGVFALQDEIALRIAEQLATKLGVAEAPSARQTIDPLAYDEYLKGRTLYRQRKGLPEAIAHLQAAVTRAPEFAAGWASLSLAHEVARSYTTPEQRAMLGDALVNMRYAAERAADLDPDAALTLHAEANVARGETRYAEAERLYQRAIQADPTYPDVREDYAELLDNVGRHEDSLVAARELVELEPFVANFWWRIGKVGVSLDHRALVDEARDRMREIDPAFRWGVLVDFYLEFWHGRIEPARAALAEAMRFSSAVAAQDAELFRWSEHDAGIDDAHARRAVVGRPEYTVFAAHRGDADLYFAAYEEQATHYYFYNYYKLPVIAPLLTDPRGKEALSRYGFVAYWREKGWPAYCRPLGDDDFECGPAVGQD